MAKIIKCPTCATPIPVSPQAVGQVIKCPGCGKGIKLVAKKSNSPSSGASSSGSPAVSRNTSSMSGSMNETYRSIMGEPALQDGPPAMGGGCARCGKIVDEADLVEDEGELICKECAIAAAGERHAGQGAIDYAPPAYVPTQRAKIINFTPMFFVFCFFAMVYGGTQVYLTMSPPPEGTKIVASKSMDHGPRAHPAAPATAPAENPAGASATPAESPAATAPVVPEPPSAEQVWEQQNKQSLESRLVEAKKLAESGSPAEALRVYEQVLSRIGNRTLQDLELSEQYAFAISERHRLAEMESHPPAASQSARSEEASTAKTPATAPALPTDPVLLALMHLKQHDYATARRLLDQIRAKAVSSNSLDTMPRLATILDGIAAASIGMGEPDLGRYAADLAYNRGVRSRSLILNRAMIHLSVLTNARDIYQTSLTVRSLMESNADDDLASTIYGMCVERMAGMVLSSADDRATVKAARDYLQSYNDHLAQSHPGRMKWGSEWLPASDVKNYRLLRGSPAETAALTLARQLEVAKARAGGLQEQIEQGRRANLDVSSSRSELDQTSAQIEKLKAQVEASKHSYYPPQWPEKFEPVLPDDN